MGSGRARRGPGRQARPRPGVGVVLAAGIRALRIGGHYGDAIGLAAAAAAVCTHVGLSLVPACVALGAAVHIAGDELTHGGCPLLYPVSRREFHLLPPPLCITTGRLAEHWIIPSCSAPPCAPCSRGTPPWPLSPATCTPPGRRLRAEAFRAVSHPCQAPGRALALTVPASAPRALSCPGCKA